MAATACIGPVMAVTPFLLERRIEEECLYCYQTFDA